MPKRGERQPWRVVFQYESQDKPSTRAMYDEESARRFADELFANAAQRETTVTVSIENRDTKERYDMTATIAEPQTGSYSNGEPKMVRVEGSKDIHVIPPQGEETVCGEYDRTRKLGAVTDSDRMCVTCGGEYGTLGVPVRQADGAAPKGNKMVATPETKEQIESNVERVRSLVQADNAEGAQELAQETENLIAGIKGSGSVAERKGYRAALAEASKGADKPKDEKSNEVAKVETEDFLSLPGAQDIIKAGAKHVADGINLNLKASETAKQVAEVILDARRRVTNSKGVPDLQARSQAARDAASEIYKAAGQQIKGDEVEVAEAVRKLQQNVRARYSDVLVTYVRELDNSPEEVETYFGFATQAYPDLTPSEAVRAYYKSIRQELPEKGSAELARERMALRRAGDEGEEKDSPSEDTTTPDQRVTLAVTTLMRDIRKVSPEDFENASADTKATVREQVEELNKAIKAMLAATL